MQHSEQKSIQQLQTELINLAVFVAQERLKLLENEAEALIQSVAAASVEEQERVRQIAIKVAITAVSAVVGSVLATVTAGAAHPLLAMATTELTKEIAAMNANATLDQMINFVNEKANAKISAIANSAVTSGTALVQDKSLDKALANAIANAQKQEAKKASEAADDILQGRGNEIIDDFYFELRKSPEAICFVRGHTATFPDTAFKQLEQYHLFVDFDNMLKQAKKFEPSVLKSVNAKVSESFNILERDRNGNPTRYFNPGHDLKKHLDNMSKLLEFLKHVPAHPIHTYFEKLPGGYDDFKALVDASKLQGIDAAQYNKLLSGIEIFKNAFGDKKFYEQLNSAVFEANKANIAQEKKEVYPYYYQEGEARKQPIQYLIQEAGIRRSRTDNFNFDNFSSYAVNVIIEDKKLESAISMMTKLGYAKEVKSNNDLKNEIVKLNDKFMKMTENIAAVKEVVESSAYGRWVDLDTQRKQGHLSNNDLLEYAALMTQIINATNFAQHGNLAQREPYLLTSKESIPKAMVFSMRAEVDKCAQIAERVAAEQALAAKIEAERLAASKPPTPPTLEDAVKDLENVNGGLMKKHADLVQELANCVKRKDPESAAEVRANINLNLDLMKFMLDETKSKIKPEEKDQKSLDKIKEATKSYEELFKNYKAQEQTQTQTQKQSRGKIFSLRVFNRGQSEPYQEARSRSFKEAQPEASEKKQSVMEKIFRKGRS